ncbi:MAG: hypothetical protein AAFR88_12000 [Pseudomonadota bacterium]
MHDNKDAQEIAELLYDTLQAEQAIRQKLQRLSKLTAKFKADYGLDDSTAITALNKADASLVRTIAATEIAKQAAIAGAATAGSPFTCPASGKLAADARRAA